MKYKSNGESEKLNNIGMLKNKNILTVLLTTEATELDYDLNSFQELVLFLVKYAFLTDSYITSETILKRQNPSHGELFFKNSNGARYLDPKYSRWISTDPALGEYVPAAGKGNSSDAGNLPGMGGIYNSVNGNLYHYAGNNPVKYTDPNGNYVILNQNQEKRTNDFLSKQKTDSIYLGYGNQKMNSFGYCFNDMKGDFPLIASTNSLRITSSKIKISTPFGDEINKSQSEYSMNGNLNDGFNAVDNYRKYKNGPVPIVRAINRQSDKGIYAIEVKIEIGVEKYEGIVAYAGESEIMTGNEKDQSKINKIANDSINFLRGTEYETQNITE